MCNPSQKELDDLAMSAKKLEESYRFLLRKFSIKKKNPSVLEILKKNNPPKSNDFLSNIENDYPYHDYLVLKKVVYARRIEALVKKI